VSPRRTILIADDAELFRDLGSLFLARTGEVVTARDGLEALARIADERPAVVVADLDMPRLDGAELCRRIKADPELQAVPVILVTSGDEAANRARAVRAGADDVIAKPISRVVLIQAVNRFLRGTGVRGLTRVPMVAEVQFEGAAELSHGIARNLSRGGIFVEAEHTAALETEVRLHFELPDTRVAIEPTAEVVWCRPRTPQHAAGMGMRFLELDRASAQKIDEYVYQRAGRIEDAPNSSGPTLR
jgi:twitching motility two-component system response regulator PilG